jgi:cyclopropane fatty-acyl-phospholipid synthase-like methyltransferase
MAANRRIERLYTHRAKLYQRFFVQFLQWEKVLEAFFQANVYLHSGMKILDAGCGSGPVTQVLYRLARQQGMENITFHGFDLTPAMLEVFRQWIAAEGVQNVQLRQADVLELDHQLPGDWTAYDLIVSSAMLEYLPAELQVQAMTNLKRLLRKDGRLLVLVTKKTWITHWFGSHWWRTRLFDRDMLQDDLHQAGFTGVQFKPLPAGWDAFMLAGVAQVKEGNEVP